MLLTDLLNSFEHSSIKGDTGIEVTDIVYDSRKASPGSMFVCIKGYVRDGHKYAAEAYAAGARSFILSAQALHLSHFSAGTPIKYITAHSHAA